jgi:hypothetical protein
MLVRLRADAGASAGADINWWFNNEVLRVEVKLTSQDFRPVKARNVL